MNAELSVDPMGVAQGHGNALAQDTEEPGQSPAELLGVQLCDPGLFTHPLLALVHLHTQMLL